MFKTGMIQMLLASLLAAGVALPAQGTKIGGTQKPAFMERETWRIEFDNDVFFNSDNGISSGLSLQWHSEVAGDWDALKKAPKFLRRLGHRIPTLTGDRLVYRAGVAIGQVIQTPDDLSRRDLIKEDIPYAGVLTLQMSWYAYNDDEFRGFEIISGVVGPLSLAGPAQKVVHKLLHSSFPQGWDNQLANEPLINLNYMRKVKIWHEGKPAEISFDVAIDGNAAMGNLFSQASTALEMRIGYNMPGGFIYMPDPIGFNMNYRATLKSARPGAGSFYGSLVLRGTALAHTIFLDGNLFRDSHRIDRKPLVGQIGAGLHYEIRHWGVHFYTLASSSVVNIREASTAEKNELVGSITIERRF